MSTSDATDIFAPGNELSLVIRILPDEISGVQRVRQALKRMLRGLRLQCREIKPHHRPPKPSKN